MFQPVLATFVTSRNENAVISWINLGLGGVFVFSEKQKPNKLEQIKPFSPEII